MKINKHGKKKKMRWKEEEGEKKDQKERK
jgi:hypothetical protein